MCESASAENQTGSFLPFVGAILLLIHPKALHFENNILCLTG